MNKKIALVLGLLLIASVAVAASRSDREWSFTQIAVSSTAVRVTNAQSGILIIQPKGAGIYIAFNSTANINAYDLYIPDTSVLTTDGSTVGASVRFGEYWTAYSAGTATANYAVLD